MVDGKGQGQEGYPCVVGHILEQAPGAGVGTVGGVLGVHFVVGEVGAVGELD